MMGAPGAASAIVLAGGRSRRFGSDKLRAELDGLPLLHLALRAVATMCSEIIVVTASDGHESSVPADLGPAVHVARDETEHPGPLAALVRGARLGTAARALVVAGDMPALVPLLLERMLRWQRGVGTCLLLDREPQMLPLAVYRDAAVAEGERRLRAGDRSLRALVAHLELERIDEPEWRPLDPEGASLRDIDLPEDLDRARARSMRATV
jgi:molybdopterin-guanine dinucleotide biosynthesis protein A